jgi:excisionase family DNA binding protein
MEPRAFLTTAEVAKTLRSSPDCIRDFIARKELAAVKLGRKWLVVPADLDAFVAGHRQPARYSTLDRRPATAGDRRRSIGRVRRRAP